MAKNIKTLTSRRAYEFRTDDLRLSTLCIKPVQEQIQQLFQFQASSMGTPMPTFGEVPATYPPGFVFDMGVWLSSDGQPVPIRFLHFEQRRIVIDVAGQSSDITAIFERLKAFLAQLKDTDSLPVIGEPERVLDYSELTARFSFSLDAVISHPLHKVFAKFLNVDKSSNKILLPALIAQKCSSNQEVATPVAPNDSRMFTFALRAGTKPEENVYFSAAPLSSETHLDYLHALEAALTGS